MEKEILKRILGIAAILLLILLGMGIILPRIISTNQFPVSVILTVAISTVILGIYAIVLIVTNVLLGKKAVEKNEESGESLFNYDTESKNEIQ